MRTATVRLEASMATKHENLWQEFQHALAKRNFVRAIELAQRLDLDEQRIRALQNDTLRQFLVEYQNFDGAARLAAEYCLTIKELVAMTDNILQEKELESHTTFSWQTGKPVYLSVAAQIRRFASQQSTKMRQQEVRQKVVGGWRKLSARIRSWVERLSNLGRGGGFPHDDDFAWQ